MEAHITPLALFFYTPRPGGGPAVLSWSKDNDPNVRNSGCGVEHHLGARGPDPSDWQVGTVLHRLA